MKHVLEQRIQEAARAHRAGRLVHFQEQEGGAGRQFVAVYRSSESFSRASVHPIFTSGSVDEEYERMKQECTDLFRALTLR